jgi:hypothetical protein
MSKDAYYFSHDSNAFHDPRIIKLRSKHGLEGYGFYWAIIEHLRNQKNYSLNIEDLDLLSFYMNSDESKIKQMLSVCLSIGLLKNENGKVFSESLLNRMEKANKIREARSNSGKMGGRPKANGKQNESKIKALKESKVNKSKLNKSKLKNKLEIPQYIDFELWVEFLNIRKKKKAINSDRALKSLLKKLKDVENNSQGRANREIERSIINSWKSIYPENDITQKSENRLDQVKEGDEF